MIAPRFSPGIIGAGGGGASARMYRLKSVQADYVTCRTYTWNSTTSLYEDGDTDVYIAKQFKLRNSIAFEIIEGQRYDYSYFVGPDTLNVVRNALISGDLVETCMVTPEWLANDLIFALGCNSGVRVGNSEIPLIMLDDGRAWARI